MKVYVLVFPQCENPYTEILGVYKTIEQAEEEQEKTIIDNIKNFDFVRDENANNSFKNDTIIFFRYQENWDNYIEYRIIEKEIK